MKMLRKLLLVVVTGLVLGAAAAPTAALANWTHGEAELEANAPIKWSGQIGFTTAGGAGAHFDVVLEGELIAGGVEGRFNKITVGACKGTGALAGLTCTGTVNAFPWKFEKLKNGMIEVKGVDLTIDFYLPNDTKHANLIAQTSVKGNFTSEPDDKTAMSSVEIASSEVTASGNPATLSGNLEVEPAGTYGTE